MKYISFLFTILIFLGCGKTLVTPISESQIIGNWDRKFFTTTGDCKSQIMGSPVNSPVGGYLFINKDGTFSASNQSDGKNAVFNGTWEIRTDDEFNFLIKGQNKKVEWNIRYYESVGQGVLSIKEKGCQLINFDYFRM